jgi:hypothetical protein
MKLMLNFFNRFWSGDDSTIPASWSSKKSYHTNHRSQDTYPGLHLTHFKPDIPQGLPIHTGEFGYLLCWRVQVLSIVYFSWKTFFFSLSCYLHWLVRRAVTHQLVCPRNSSQSLNHQIHRTIWMNCWGSVRVSSQVGEWIVRALLMLMVILLLCALHTAWLGVMTKWYTEIVSWLTVGMTAWTFPDRGICSSLGIML